MTDSIFSYAEKDAFKKSYIVDYMRRYPMWDLLNKKGRVMARAGDRLNQPYATNRPTGYSYGRDSTVQATQKGEIVQAWFDWGALAMDTKEYGWDIDRQGAQGQIESGTLAKLFATRIELLKDAYYYEHNDRVWNGDGLAYGGGTDKSFLGIDNQIVTSPSSGSHGGLSRTTYDELQNQQISGTSGPSSDWEADAWERMLTLKVAIMNHQTGKKGNVKPDFCTVTEGSYVDIINLGYVQNTNVGVDVKDVESVSGIQFEVNHAQDSNTVYMGCTGGISIYYPEGWDGPIQLDIRDEFKDRMNLKDCIAIVKSELCPIVEAPFMQGVITSAG